MPRTIDPRKQYMIDGEPMVGGFIYYGVAGSDPKTTPINIFTDEALTVPAVNPQTTDSQGFVANNIYVDDNEYSFLVEDSANVQILLESRLEPLNVQGLITADIDMNGNTLTDVRDATANDEPTTLGQANKLYADCIRTDGSSTVDAWVANLPVAPDSLDDTQQVTIYSTVAENTSTTPTLDLNGFGAKTIVRSGNFALLAGDLGGTTFMAKLIYSSSLDVWVLQNPFIAETKNIEDSAITANKINTDAVTTSKIFAQAVTTAKLDDNGVTYAKIQNVSTSSRILGRASGAGAGDPTELTATQVLSVLGFEQDTITDHDIDVVIKIGSASIRITCGAFTTSATDGATQNINFPTTFGGVPLVSISWSNEDGTVAVSNRLTTRFEVRKNTGTGSTVGGAYIAIGEA